MKLKSGNKFTFIFRSILLAFLLISIGGCSEVNEKKECKELTVVAYGGGAYFESHIDIFAKPYQEESGMSIKAINWDAEYGKLKTMIEVGKISWDVVEVPNSHYKRGKREGLFEDLITFPPSDEFIDGTIESTGVANIYWGTVLSYNSSDFTEKPTSWQDFWNISNFPGGRALFDDPRGNLEFALLADGVSKDSLYPLDVSRAFKKLDELKPYIKVWWNKGTQPVELLNSDVVSMTSAWNGRIYAMRQQDTESKIEYVWNGAGLDLDWWVIPKGSNCLKEASEYIKYISSSRGLADQAEYLGYGPVNTMSLELLPPNIREDLPTYEKNWELSFVINSDWWAENEKEVKLQWVNWKNN